MLQKQLPVNFSTAQKWNTCWVREGVHTKTTHFIFIFQLKNLVKIHLFRRHYSEHKLSFCLIFVHVFAVLYYSLFIFIKTFSILEFNLRNSIQLKENLLILSAPGTLTIFILSSPQLKNEYSLI